MLAKYVQQGALSRMSALSWGNESEGADGESRTHLSGRTEVFESVQVLSIASCRVNGVRADADFASCSSTVCSQRLSAWLSTWLSISSDARAPIHLRVGIDEDAAGALSVADAR